MHRGRKQSEVDAKRNVKEKSKPVLKDRSTKLCDQFTNQFTKQIQISKLASSNTTSMLKQIRKQLTQNDKTTASSNIQQVVIRQLVVQVKAMQKKLDKVGSSVNRIKIFQLIREKVLGINAARNEFQILLILISLHHQYSCQKTTT